MKYNQIITHVLLVGLGILLFNSCKSSKEVPYFQDLQYGNVQMQVTSPNEIKIQPKDKLSILVNSQDIRLTNLFNLPVVSQQVGDNASNYSTGRGMSGYTVDSKGDIDFPVIGKMHVAGMTREKVAAYIKGELTSRSLVKDPVITVEFMNLSVSVLGEVNHPGRYSIDKDNITLLDALSMAGDLTIYGKRENVLVLRNEDGKQQTYRINLCMANNLYSSPAYYLQQNDVVYVEPNATKARQSTVNGNNVRSTSFWMSIASLASTIAVLILTQINR